MSSSDPSNSKNLTCRSKNQADLLYIYDLPSAERKILCAILDDQNAWNDLAITHMGYSNADLQSLRRTVKCGNSPTDELLNMWGDQNHTVTELFILLHRMQQYQAMDVIKVFVDRKYYRLIMTDQPDLTNLLQNKGNTTKQINGFSNSNNISCATSSVPTSESSNIKGASGALDLKNINEYASTIPQINYTELVDATNNWSNNQVLGKGGFGTVYKGIWKFTAVAIKRIEYHGTGISDIHKIQIQQSLNELKYLNACRHDNILPLYGYSVNGNEPCLIYQLMSGGSLEERLKSNQQNPLTWIERLNIAKGTARGLQYLHTFKEKPLIHGDIKPANILLDPCNQPKIGDFGLAREGPNALNTSMTVSRVYGTKPYLPVEFLGYKTLSTKVDTFSFGVVLFEIITGLRAYDTQRTHKFLSKHILAMHIDKKPINDLIDRNCHIDAETINIYKMLYRVATACISENSKQRPEMSVVLQNLENY